MRDELKRLKKAVRDKCLECSGGTPAEVALCELEECPLYPFRVELWPSLFNDPSQNANAPKAEAASEDEKPSTSQLSLF